MNRLSRLWAIALTIILICCSSGGGAPKSNDDGGGAGDGGAAGSGNNRAPSADAGPAQTVDVGDKVTLDGSGSTDPDGDALSFAWTVLSQPVGAKVSLSDPTAVRPKFEMPQTGSYVFELVVSDAELSSSPARVSVSTSDNRPPIASAGEDIAAKVGDEVTLDGSASSDPDGDKISYSWRFKEQPDGSEAALSDSSAIAPLFTVDVEGDYLLELIVNDGTLDSDPVVVTVSTGNLAPRAEIAVKTDPVRVDASVSLDGTGSHDANGDRLSYHWSLLSQPKGSTATLEKSEQSKATLTPDLRGDYVVQLIVDDGKVDSKPVTALLTPDNRAPTADAGLDGDAQVGQSLALDGSGSSDPDHDPLKYTWTLETRPSGSEAKLSKANTATPTLVPDAVGAYVVNLTVNDGDATSDADSVAFSVTAGTSSPIITSFSPASGPAGTLVTVIGSGFASPDGVVRVFVMTAAGLVEATVVSATDTQVQFILPPGATTGSFTLQVGDQKTESSTPLTIEPSAEFELAVEPSTVSLNPGVSVSAVVRLATTSGFADLADLTIEGLPAGVTAAFTPKKIRAGDWALLTLHAAADQAASQIQLTVRASAEIDNASHSELGALAVTVPPTTTAFVGRAVLDDPRETPLIGVTVTLLGKNGNAGSTNCQGTTKSDAAGNFAFTNLPVGCTSNQLVRYDGLTVTQPAGKYAGVDLSHTIAPGVATQAAALVHLPRIDNAPTVGVKQNAPTDQIFTYPSIPNLELTVYAGTTLTMPDGSKPDPFPLTAVPVPVDRLPEEVPQTQPGFHFFIIAFQPANAFASQPVAVSYPNELAFPPATAMPLLTLDPERGVMVQYGTGKVSDDGLKILPDADPKYPGRKFGIVHFDWHGPFSFLEPIWKWLTGSGGTGCPPKTGQSVDLATGLEQHVATDIAIDGRRGGIAIVRMFRTVNQNVGPFGIGTSHNYHYQLSTQTLTGTTFNLIQPNGNAIPFAKQADGTYVNKTDPTVAGAVFRPVSGGSELRLLDGSTLGFQPFPRMGGSMLTSITDTNGNTVTLTRVASSPFAITTVTDPVGRQLTLSYDASARVSGITDPLGRKVSYAYGTDGYLSTVTNVLGGVTKYAYTAKGELASITDPRNVKVLELTYDANGRASSETVVGSGKSTFEYTVVNSRMPKSPVVQTQVTDPAGNLSTYRFNPQGYLLSATDALGQTQTLNREVGSNRILETLGSGTCGTCNGGAGHHLFEYNSNGQVVKQTDEVGATAQIQYESTLGRPARIEDALGNLATLVYDTRGNVTQVTSALKHTNSFEYDSHGQVTAVVDGVGKRSRLSYDGAGNLVSVTDPAGNITRMRYDAVSRLVETTDALGRRSIVRYDAANHVTQTVDPAGSTTKFTYDDIGNITSLSDPRGAVTKYEYDAAGRLVKRTDPVQAAEQFTYDALGHLSQHVDRRGLIAKFAYDALDRVTSATYADSTVDYRYDAEGNVAGVTDSLAGEYRFTFDTRNLLTGMQGPSGALSYTRDKFGRVTSESVLGQPDTTFSYNAGGQYTSIETEGAGVSFEYDAFGRLTTETRQNGVVTHYAYDELGAVNSVRHELKGSNIDLQAYEHDGTGATTHSEDSLLGSLSTAETTATYDLANRIQTWGSKTFTHDQDGNRLKSTEGSSSESYAWDARGRLKSITQADGTVIGLGYDFAGNLARITTPAGDETQLTDASGNVILRRTRDGNIQRLLNGLSMDHQIALLDSVQGVRYPLITQPNSTIATVDGKGIVDGQYSYEPYGATGVTRDPSASYPFLFTGRTRVTDGLYYYRARFYDPLTSRFVSEDPLGFGGGDLNLYGYVGGSPADRVDPTGKVWTMLAGGVVNVGINGALATARGECYTASDALRDFIVGAAVGGATEALVKAGAVLVRGALALRAGSAAAKGVPGLSVSNDGIAIWAKVAGDAKASARVLQEPGALHVTDIFRGAQGAGSGSQILAAALREGGLSSGQRLVFKGIINPETLATYQAGGSAAESLLGRLGSKTLNQMGMEASSFEFQLVRGKLDLVIGVK